MKNKEQGKINLKKLTIAKINVGSMKKIEGGSSVLTSQYWEQNGVVINYCYYEK